MKNYCRTNGMTWEFENLGNSKKNMLPKRDQMEEKCPNEEAQLLSSVQARQKYWGNELQKTLQ